MTGELRYVLMQGNTVLARGKWSFVADMAKLFGAARQTGNGWILIDGYSVYRDGGAT